MKPFIHDHFLLQSETARRLYHEHAKALPIIDYHCHLDPQAIAEDRKFGNIAELWLGGDHYKWRALRTFGVEERYITGDAPPEEKFRKWSEVLPYTVGNPLFHWSALELKAYFGIEELLTPANWRDIYDRCNEALAQPSFSARGLITSSNVKWICTTDDPADDLRWHRQLAEDESFRTGVTPTFRPDKALAISAPGFTDYVKALEAAAGHPIDSYGAMEAAMLGRMEAFDTAGCFISDHGLTELQYEEGVPGEAEAVFASRLAGQTLNPRESRVYATALFLTLARKYAALGWTMQLHIGAIRNPNTRMFNRLGPDTGFDTIGDAPVAEALGKTLDALDRTDELPKTILYNLNAVHNDVFATMIGSFQQEGFKGKIQFGSGWWYNDQKDGMLKQLGSLANMGLLSCFVGMLTDSRSFLSYTRHEYFRRIVCNLLGEWVQKGEVPNDLPFLGGIVEDICHHNANSYFGLEGRAKT